MLFNWLEITDTAAGHQTLLEQVLMNVFLPVGVVSIILLDFYYKPSTSFDTATPAVEISTPEEAVYSESFQAACTGSLQPHVAPYLAQYLTVNWRGIDELSPQDGITVDKQQKSANGLTKTLVFHPLTMAHGGNYTCEAKVVLPGSAGSFNTTLEHHINVLSESVTSYYTLQWITQLIPQIEHLFS